MNVEEIFKIFETINQAEFQSLFKTPNLSVNQNYFLTRKLKKCIASDSISKCLMKQYVQNEITLNIDELKTVLDNTFRLEGYSQKELLNLFLQINSDFIEPILESKLFEKILIINDSQDYETDALIIKEGTPISFMLLQKQDLKQQIFIKRLVNSKGFICIEYLDHLDKCLALLNDKAKMRKSSELQFILDLEISQLQKVMKKFNLNKYIIRFAHFDEFLTFDQIERLFFLKGNFMDIDMFYILYNNYYQSMDDDPDYIFLKNILKDKEVQYTNYEIALWVTFNEDIYCDWYEQLEEFHIYSFPDPKICDLFLKGKVFVEKLANPEHINQFLYDYFEVYEGLNHRKMLAKFVEYSLRNYKDPSFTLLTDHPEKVLLKMEKMQKHFSPSLEKSTNLKIKFREHIINTNVGELMNINNWLDFPNFSEKFLEGKIGVLDVLDLKAKSREEILRSKFINITCGICLKMVDNLYIFIECSHPICLICLKAYLKTTMKLTYKKNDQGNKASFYLMRQVGFPIDKVRCPTCKKIVEIDEQIHLLKLFF